ncbi:stress responsive A/B barrel domain-containing protein [Triangularia verruculosa]|uniref:Stress responsive A/B barrel domain-containing protein n=1 Tax=Triangularia verruculosa TaxID=2587418 RepID=A0AAN6X6B9_9PEZI|nr:stress responsive A/B barrel domain-containing protein [Triangularia verruculosa]
MVNVTGAQPHMLRIIIALVCILSVFLFFDPIGFASTMNHQLATPGSTTTVTHIVLFKFKSDLDGGAIDVAAAKILSLKENCLSPNSQNAYIKSITGGRDNSPENLQNGMTHAFVVQFENTDDRNYYVEQDPAHLAFKKEIEPLVEKVMVLDYINGVF